MATVCTLFLDDEEFDDIDCPSCSPDLSPIENVQDVVYQNIRRWLVAPQTLQELTDALIQVWQETPSTILSGACPDILHIGTWWPYTLLTYIMNCFDEVHAS